MPEYLSNESVGARLILDEAAWIKVYEEVFSRAQEIIHSKFGPDNGYYGAEDAIASAIRTTHRRYTEGLLGKGLNSLEGLCRLLLVVARNKFIDRRRKAGVETRIVDRLGADAERADVQNARDSAVLVEIIKGECVRDMNEAMAKLEGSLDDPVEWLVFRGKLEKLEAREIAEKFESETGERMTRDYVKELWRTMRARFNREFPELRSESPHRRKVGLSP